MIFSTSVTASDRYYPSAGPRREDWELGGRARSGEGAEGSEAWGSEKGRYRSVHVIAINEDNLYAQEFQEEGVDGGVAA